MLKRIASHGGRGVLAATLLCGSLPAQMTVTGSITGDVADPTGHAIAGAKVTLTSVGTSQVRSTTTNETGTFTLPAVQPDTYSLRVEQKGFKAYSRSPIVVTAND